LPTFCPACTKAIDKDKKEAASKPKSYKMVERLRKGETTIKTI
jgi:predicted nucleic acid-binding Zn ribbon protein